MAEAAFRSNETGFREIHQTFENSALQVAAVLPSDAKDLPDEVMFPNQTIPVLPDGHWATSSGEIWVPVEKSENKQNSQLVFAVYNNLDVLFGDEIESDFLTIDLDDPSSKGVRFFFVYCNNSFHPSKSEQDFAINSEVLDGDEDFDLGGNVTETCFQMENGTERCTSNDESKPHLTLNSHIISATLRPPNNDFFHVRSVNITMKVSSCCSRGQDFSYKLASAPY